MYNVIDDVKIKEIDLSTTHRLKVESFLSTFNLLLDDDIDHTIIAHVDKEIIGTCSSAKNIIKSFAVKKGYQDQGIASKLITHITNHLFEKGIYETFIFTKPNNLALFEGLNYRKVQATDKVVLLEGGMADINRTINAMFINSNLDKSPKAALVMNCNPFTLGHRYIIEKASMENEQVVVFIVEEDASVFPFQVRMELARLGTKDLENVFILPGGKYIISSNTFPSYFIRQRDLKANAYAELDGKIFGKYISPAFNIKKRYLGSEPYCKTTNFYNQVLSSVLPEFGIKVVEIKRLPIEKDFISASRVRKLIKHGTFQEVSNLVPKSTMDFINSPKAKDIIKKIEKGDSPH